MPSILCTAFAAATRVSSCTLGTSLRVIQHEKAFTGIPAGAPGTSSAAQKPSWPGAAAPTENGHISAAEAAAIGLPNGGGAVVTPDHTDAASPASGDVRTGAAAEAESAAPVAPDATEGPAADALSSRNRCMWQLREQARGLSSTLACKEGLESLASVAENAGSGSGRAFTLATCRP